MKQHQFRLTLEHLSDKDGHPVAAEPLVFLAPNHDNIFDIVKLMEQRKGFTPEMAQRFAVGLKLMGEVMLGNTEHPLFAELKPHFMEIMEAVKRK